MFLLNLEREAIRNWTKLGKKMREKQLRIQKNYTLKEEKASFSLILSAFGIFCDFISFNRTIIHLDVTKLELRIFS